MYTNFLQPSILEPIRIAAYNRPSLLDNTFISTSGKEVTIGNLVDKIRDHMPNFVIATNIFGKKKKVKIRYIKNLCKETFLNVLYEIKSLGLLKHNEFQNKFVEIVDKNALYKTLSKIEKKLKEKPLDH